MTDNEQKEPHVMKIDDTVVGFWINNVDDEGNIDLTYSIIDGPTIEDAVLQKHISSVINEALSTAIENELNDRESDI